MRSNRAWVTGGYIAGGAIGGALIGAIMGVLLVFGILSPQEWRDRPDGVEHWAGLAAIVYGVPWGAGIGALAGIVLGWRLNSDREERRSE